jgi:hypothetical protein
MPGTFRQRPAVLLRQLRQQPLNELREHRPRLQPVEQVPQRTSQGGQFSIPPGYLLSRHTQHHARSTTPRRLRHKISGCSTCFSRAKNAIHALSGGLPASGKNGMDGLVCVKGRGQLAFLVNLDGSSLCLAVPWCSTARKVTRRRRNSVITPTAGVDPRCACLLHIPLRSMAMTGI